MADAKRIEGSSLVSQAKNKVKATQNQRKVELELLKQKILQELSQKEQQVDLEIETKKQEAEIEVDKFKKTVDNVGKETIIQMARAGPEMQAKLLKGLGLKGFMVMDGKNPINLLNQA